MNSYLKIIAFIVISLVVAAAAAFRVSKTPESSDPTTPAKQPNSMPTPADETDIKQYPQFSVNPLPGLETEKLVETLRQSGFAIRPPKRGRFRRTFIRIADKQDRQFQYILMIEGREAAKPLSVEIGVTSLSNAKFDPSAIAEIYASICKLIVVGPAAGEAEQWLKSNAGEWVEKKFGEVWIRSHPDLKRWSLSFSTL